MSTFFIGVPTEVHIPGLMQADQRSLNPAIPLMSIGVIQPVFFVLSYNLSATE